VEGNGNLGEQLLVASGFAGNWVLATGNWSQMQTN
jgi:hypothetical protein